MKKNYGCLVPLALVVLLILTLFVGFRVRNTPPSAAAAEQLFYQNREDIRTVVEFMAESGYEDIYIRDDGTYHAG